MKAGWYLYEQAFARTFVEQLTKAQHFICLLNTMLSNETFMSNKSEKCISQRQRDVGSMRISQ